MNGLVHHINVVKRHLVETTFSTTIKILDENDNVLSITTLTRNNDAGYRSNTYTYTDTATYTDTGSRKWDWQWQGIDGNSS